MKLSINLNINFLVSSLIEQFNLYNLLYEHLCDKLLLLMLNLTFYLFVFLDICMYIIYILYIYLFVFIYSYTHTCCNIFPYVKFVVYLDFIDN